MSDKRPSVVTSRDAEILTAARAEFLRGQVPSAIRKYESLVRVYPNHGPVLAELAQIYLKIGRWRDAEPLLDGLLKVPSPNVNDLRVAASGLRKIGRNHKAIAALETLVKSHLSLDHAFSATVELAELAERTNDLEVAQRAVDWLSELGPNSFPFEFLSGKLAFRMGRLDAALAHLQRAASQPALSLEQKCQVHYAVGKVLDRLGRFDEAFANFVTAKSVEHPQAHKERRKAAWMCDLVLRVTDELRIRPPAPLDRRGTFGRPLCFLTGHPRSGTTLLEQMLTTHPAIATADENSAMFQRLVTPLVFPSRAVTVDTFPLALPRLNLSDLQTVAATPSRIAIAIEQYRTQLEWLASDVTPGNYLIDKSPAGLIDLPMIESILPETKVVVMVRDPRDVCLSCFQEDFGLNSVSINFSSLETTAEKLLRDFEFWLMFRRSTSLPWLEVYYERLVANPEFELRRICDFLALEWSPNMLTFQASVGSRSIQSPTYAQVMEPISNRSIGRWRNYRASFALAEELLNPLCRQLGYDNG